MAERLQKWLADLGLGSRRQIETWIKAGRIKVDGEPAVLGQKVTGTERILVDGNPVRGHSGRRQETPQVLIYHKPAGEVCTRSDPEGRPTVFERLPEERGFRWVIVGRLDVDTSGLLIFTTDGALAHALMHPSTGLRREYAARVRGNPSAEVLAQLRSGVRLEDGMGRFDTLEFSGGEGANSWYRVSVTEGRNRLIRRLWEAVDCQVSRLIRVRFGPVELPRRLPRGRYRLLRPAEIVSVYEAVRLPVPKFPATA